MPNYRNVLKVYKLERELAPDDIALLNTLRDMSDSERELLAETLGPVAKGKAGKSSSKPATKHFKKCGTCGISKRAAHHRDVNHRDYHEFDEGGTASTEGKSKRASGMAAVINDSLQRSRQAAALDIPALCTYEMDGKTCKGSENDGIHDPAMGYGGYHEFQPQSAPVAQEAGVGG